MQQLEGLPFQIVGINSDEDREKAIERCRDSGISWPSFYAGDVSTREDKYSDWWTRNMTPQFFLIDEKGFIRAQFQNDVDSIYRGIELLLKEMGHDIKLVRQE